MPTLWAAGPWQFEAAVTITECNEQSVTNWLQFAQIADYLPIYRYASTVSARRILTIRAWDLIQRSERHAGWASQSG